MTEIEAKERYTQAEELYKAGQYTASLALLDELDRAYPKERNILYARAMNLASLGRKRDALKACDYLVAVYADSRGEALKVQLDPRASSRSSSPGSSHRRSGPPPAMIAVGAVLVIAVLAVAFFVLF